MVDIVGSEGARIAERKVEGGEGERMQAGYTAGYVLCEYLQCCKVRNSSQVDIMFKIIMGGL